MSSRLWLILGGIAGLLVILVVFLVSRLDSDQIGQAVLSRVNQNPDLQVEAEGFDLGIFSGIRLEGVRTRGRTESGPFQGEIAEVVLEHELIPLLRGQVVLNRLIVRNPDLQLTTGHEAQAQPAEPEPEEVPAEGQGLDVQIAQIRVEDGNIEIVDEQRPDNDIQIEGLNLDLTDVAFTTGGTSPLEALEARGSLLVERLRFSGIEARSEGQIQMSQGVANVSDLHTTTQHGEVTVEQLTVDLTQNPFRYDLQGDGRVDLNSLTESPEKGFGEARLNFDAQGAGPETDRLTGTGKIDLESGTLPSNPTIKQIESFLSRDLISGRPYESTQINITVQDGKVDLEPFNLVSENATLRMGGSVELEGLMQLDVQLSVAADAVSLPGVSNQVLSTVADQSGAVTIPLNVTGTPEQPTVSVDQAELSNMLKSSAGRALERGLRNLLGGSRDQ